ncbi:Ada metal-binding domain-containing protein [Sphingobacterium prati]|uniref:Ada metal-binding domain-containing protein n=1 Tax=Sphingobacterium prati TaxID=2737006 RepID=UPI001C12E80A
MTCLQKARILKVETCRPSCNARKPKSDNIEFIRSTSGYRACKVLQFTGQFCRLRSFLLHYRRCN